MQSSADHFLTVTQYGDPSTAAEDLIIVLLKFNSKSIEHEARRRLEC